MNKKKLLVIIEKIGKAPWEKGEGVEKLIPLGAVIQAIESPAQGVSPAELGGDSWVLEKLKEYLKGKVDAYLVGVRNLIRNLESDASQEERSEK